MLCLETEGTGLRITWGIHQWKSFYFFGKRKKKINKYIKGESPKE
jgi:hypothetical protein